MNKNVKLALIIGAVAISAYLLFRWYQKRQSDNSNNGSPTGGLGSNLNSVAPELVGGSAGPSVGPVLSSPVNITLNSSAPPPAEVGSTPMVGASTTSTNMLMRQNDAASGAGIQTHRTSEMSDVLQPDSGMSQEPMPMGMPDEQNTDVPA